ncbi:MAG: S66 peptidase family protein [Ruminiclostridium sp.]
MAIAPALLQIGDTFGIVTLGSPLNRNTINQRISYLQSFGYNTVIGTYVYASTGFLAGTDQQRASDLMSMFQNKNVKAILPVRGGVGVSGILPYLDFNIILENPKIISGFSDITVLLNVLYQYANLITFQSLLLIDFISTTPVYNFNQFFSATASTAFPRLIQNPPGIPLVSRVSGNVTGILVGGNLTSFIGTLGTPYEIDTNGKILFLEEVHETMDIVYRYMNHLRLAGKLDACIGIIMGECTGCINNYGVSYENLINEILIPLGKPLMTNLMSAHGTYKAALPIGARINLNTINNTITILEPTVI